MSENQVYTFAKWKVREGQLTNVLTLLAGVAKQTVKEKGNLFYHVHQSLSDPNTLVLFEGYRDQSAQDAHRAADYFQQTVIAQVVPLLENREVITASRLELE